MPCFYIFCKELLVIYYTFCDELWRYHYTFCKELYDSLTHTCNFPPCITFWRTSSTGGLLRFQHPSMMHEVGIAQEEP